MATIDTTAPQLTYVFVSSSENQVGFTLLFSESIRPNAASFGLYAWSAELAAIGSRISLFSQFVTNSNNLSLLPLGTVEAGQAYQLTVARDAVLDLSGNALGADLPIFLQPIDLTGGLSLQIWGKSEEGAALEAKLASVSILSGAVKASYQWQVKTDSVWTNLPSANTAVLSIPSDQSWVGKEIRVSVQTSLALSGFTQFQSLGLKVANVNDTPVAAASNFTLVEDSVAQGNLSASDDDANVLTFVKVTDPAHGSVTVNATTGAYTYTPAVNYNGSDSFTFKVNDGLVDSAVATVSLSVSAVNDAPTAQASSLTTDEDVIQAGTLAGSDVEGSALTFLKVSNPSHGSVSLNASTGAYTYTPSANYNGSDSFSFKVNDGVLDSETATVSLTVRAVNDAPVANSTGSTTQEDSPKTGTLTGTDVEGSSLTFVKVSDPAHGSVTVNTTTGAYTYTPAANYNGTDSFTFKVNDGALDSALATITLTINAVNDAPTASAVSAATSEDTAKTGTLMGSDVEGSTLTFAKVSDPSHGSVTVNASTGAYTYTPAANYNGTDSFTFKVNDGSLDSEAATVSLVISAVNDAPTASPTSATSFEDTIQTGTLTGNDVEGSSLTFAKVSDPSHGSVTVNATTGAYTYTPAANYNGTDSFTFKVNDGTLNSEAATVLLVISAVNDAPTASAASATTSEDTAKTGTLTGTDIEGSSLTFAKVSDPSHGSVTVNATTGAYTYTPAANYNGTDSFTFKVNDGALDSDTATITLTVSAVNDAPVGTATSITTDEDTAKTGTLAGTDIEGSTLTFAKVSDPSHGSVTVNATTGAYTYTPAANFNGTDSFTFMVNDGVADSEAASVLITVGSVNDAPVATDLRISTAEDTALSGHLSGTDPEGSALTWIQVAEPSHGTVTLSAITGAYVYTPAANYNGTDSFTFKVNDGALDSETATVFITLTAVNDAPTAVAIGASTNEDTAKSGLLSGTDVEGSTLTFAKVTDPQHGTVTLNATTGAYTYTPAANYNGSDSFTYKVNDGVLDSAVSQVTVTVAAVNDAPVANALRITTDEDTPSKGQLTGADTEGSALSFVKVSDPSRGTVVINAATGAYTYTPVANANGVDRFSFKVNDGALDSEVASVEVQISAVNDAPVASSLSVNGYEDGVLTGVLPGSDVEGSALTYAKLSDPLHGVVVLNTATGSYTYTPAANYNGSDSFTFKVNDGALDSGVGTLSVSLAAVNDAPQANGVTLSGFEDTVKTGQLTGSDVEGSALSFAKVSEPSHGSLTLNTETGAFSYTPELNFWGADHFTFRVSDGAARSDPVEVTFLVNAMDDPASASLTVTGTGLLGTSLSLSVSDLQDPDGTVSFATQWQSKQSTGEWVDVAQANSVRWQVPTDAAWTDAIVRAQVTTTDEGGGTTLLYSPEKQIVSGAYHASIKAYYASQLIDPANAKLLGNVTVTFPGFQGTTVSLTSLESSSIVDNDATQDGQVSFTASAPLPNDVRQAISLTDVLSALKIYLGKPTPVDTPKTLSKLAADFDADGQVTLSDVLMLLKYYLGKENALQPQWAWIDRQKIGAAEELSSSLGVHDFTESSNVELVGILRGDVDFSWGG
ncbi:MAG: tandem-95 repeat protein [Limnohabitans sp.]|nr:tandem-95 repeat protein [Limnohabitans sp.]